MYTPIHMHAHKNGTFTELMWWHMYTMRLLSNPPDYNSDLPKQVMDGTVK